MEHIPSKTSTQLTRSQKRTYTEKHLHSTFKIDYDKMSKSNLGELYELAQARIPPVSNIKFHSWEQITTPENQIIWQGKLTVTLSDWEVPMKEQTVEAQGLSKKTVQQELARRMLEIISETFKRSNTCRQ